MTNIFNDRLYAKEVKYEQEVMDKIVVYAEGSDKAAALMQANEGSIKSDVMADALVTGSMDGYSKEWNINGEKVTLGVKKNAE